MKKNIVQLTEEYVLKLFEDQFPPGLLYHDLDHTMSVRETALELGRYYDIGEENLEAMELATLLHDIGYIKAYSGHEDVSMEMAENFLSQHNYPAEKLQIVKELVAATKLIYQPKNQLQKIIKDADLNNLGQGKYLKTISKLRTEMETFLGQHYEDQEWFEMNIKFMDDHIYFTEKAKELFNDKKHKNRRKVSKVIKSLKEKKKKPPKTKIMDTINSNRSAQMMFKTALRNHIDLTSIADNKANIMLSINALIITISMPLLAANIEENPRLLVPTSILLVTCVASIIFATLATRPIKTKGLTTMDSINQGPTNLFFFGNFYRMKFAQYKDGIKMIIADNDKLDNSIMSDLYYLGKALGNKFNQLRVCYTIFMIGITLTVIAFAITFFISSK